MYYLHVHLGKCCIMYVQYIDHVLFYIFSQASPYEFVQRWNAIPRTAQSIEYARLLEQITPETLPEVITNKLDGMMLTNIIRAIDKQFVPKSKSIRNVASH